MRKAMIGKAFPMGASIVGKGMIQFVSKAWEGKQCELIIYYDKNGKKEIVPLTEEYRIGNVYSVVINDLKVEKITYNYMVDSNIYIDPYARLIRGNESWGRGKNDTMAGALAIDDYLWDYDRRLNTPYEKSFIYQLHVRGFTKHNSSKVKAKGTFEGICEKIDYFKELGSTALELLPCDEFYELEDNLTVPLTMEEAKLRCGTQVARKEQKINYWGFKEGFYFAPKASYSIGKNPVYSFKRMVDLLHSEGIEVIMQFYFPRNITRGFIIEVVKYWMEEYCIDGVRLLGVDIPVEIMSTLPEFSNFKILYETFKENEIYSYNQIPVYRNLAEYNDRFLYIIRKFLKGDVGSLQAAFDEMMWAGQKISRIVYLTNYNSFTLNDLVSYDRKHNESNGEAGSDGNDYNLSWNCGAEGNTKRKNILELRKQQMRNALTLLFLSKATPVILAGDEFCNSQNGNNNPYCQDNAVSWLNWNDLERNRNHFEFCRKIIEIVKNEPLFKSCLHEPVKQEERKYPPLSYHGKEAWKLEWSAANEEAGGILYSGCNKFIYIAVNMHWKETYLALPNLPTGSLWQIIHDTSLDNHEVKEEFGKKRLLIEARTIKILLAERKDLTDDNKGNQTF